MEYPQHLEQSTLQHSVSYYRVVTDEVEKAILIILAESKKPVKKSDLVKKVIKMTKADDIKVYRRIRKLFDEGIIEANVDARDTYLYLHKDKVKISRNYMVYIHFYLLTMLSLIISGILSYFMMNPSIILGSIITSVFILLKCFVDIMTRKDLLIVKVKMG